MTTFGTPAEWALGIVLLLSALGVILAPKPVHASLSFLLTLIALAALYLQLSAQFIAAMQILVYAGAILVLFMFVIILFQDAHSQIAEYKANSSPILLGLAGIAFASALILVGSQLMHWPADGNALPPDYGTIQALGKALYLDFFFPFEAIILLFLVAIVGALYIGKKAEL
jgi:NADH-quinone oxidoreductase subunit J